MPHRRPWLLIGVSARIYYPEGPVLDLGGVWTRTLHFLEQSVAHWIIGGGALPVMVPAADADSLVHKSEIKLAHFAEALDALVLQGGNDISPESYGETPLHPDWGGDRVRDRYEMALARAFIAQGKPVFGICRGFQLLNVMHGGTLLQDISMQRPDAASHRDVPRFERHFHDIDVMPGTRLARLYPQVGRARVNSIHHQGIKDLADGFEVEARSSDDGLIEAIRRSGPGYVAAVQWHPEFHSAEHGSFDDSAMLHDFLSAARLARER
jgi:putative glutamine amidotransferase